MPSRSDATGMHPCTLRTVEDGDFVLVDGLAGEVVFCSVSDSYAHDFPKSEWPPAEYRGLMIRQDNGALIFHEEYWFTGTAPVALEWDHPRKASD